MLTKFDIQAYASENFGSSNVENVAKTSFIEGAEWANRMNAIEISDLKQMLISAWLEGNRQGWDQNTDWPEDADKYAEHLLRKYTLK